MRIGKKWFASTLLLVTALSSLTACGSGTSSEGAAGSGSTEPVKIRMIESLTSPARTEVLKQMVSKFEEANPGIDVELISPPLDSADTKIAQMLSSKADIDVLEVRDSTVKQFVTNNWIADLSPYTSKWSGYGTLNASAQMSANYIENKPYYIPYGLYEKILFYRTDWFKEKGLEAPKTWEELYAAAKAITDPSKNRYGYSFRGGKGADSYIVDMIRDYNGTNTNPEDAMFLKNGNTIFSTPEAKQALENHLNIYKDGSPKDSVNWGFAEMVEGFEAGVTGMLIQDPDVIDVVKQKMGEGTWSTAAIPAGPSGVTHYKVGAAGWGMAAHSEHKDEAWKLIEFLSSPEQNEFFTQKIGLIPVHTTASENEFYKTGYYKPYMDMNADAAHYIPVKPETDYKGFGEWRSIIQQDTQAIIFGRLSVDDALKKWDAYWLDQKKQGK
ncbi:ABC transporter substrate-binding protein [Paenibacillus sabinae]|uniref:ABC transporter substrate-binding protein n=1 Tax=Paenibacillus sabinae T27 TaxID=1268072 RepID=X4ZIE6_9BACL|nr:sugar ABC transporter substrate-binding protein [Paenibacillus sabinae]AHV96480.1 ABC transporter substrate-binding protein [Paenibacillus sabinae T27]